MYLSSFGHISATIPPMDLKPLSSASSYAVPCITGAMTASLHHWKPYKGLLWLICTIIATTLGTTLDVPSFGHISTTIPTVDLKPLSSASSDAVPCITVAITASLHHCNAIQRLTLVVMYYHCNHLRNHLGCTFFWSYLNNHTTCGPQTTFICIL